DYAAAERFWSPAYIQHSAHIAPGREGLFELVKAAPKELHYENALIVADGDYVTLHGRFSGIGQPVNWVVVDILRIGNGLLAEHWDVIQDEATRESSKSGRPMFGDKFPAYRHEQAMTLGSTPPSIGQFLFRLISHLCGFALWFPFPVCRYPPSCSLRPQESRLDRHGASGGGVSLARISTSLSTPDSTLNVV
ncbi:MAG: nuclear transport factor 2 family protein, partial [Methylocella sp.]